MTDAEWIGSVGVALLLAAFFANLFGFLSQRSRAYAGLNFVGASLSCYASWRIGFAPFVVLEGVWAAVAATGFVRAAVRAH